MAQAVSHWPPTMEAQVHNQRPAHVRFVVDKVTVEQVFL